MVKTPARKLSLEEIKAQSEALESEDQARPGTPQHRPWDQQRGESDQSFRKFQEYLTGGYKTIKEYIHSDSCGDSATSIYQLAQRWRWRARRAYWEDVREREGMEARKAAAIDQAQAHMDAWAQVAELAVGEIRRMLAGGVELTPAEALAMLSKATDYQRLFAGEVTSRSGVKVEASSTEDLEALEAQLRKIAGLDADIPTGVA